MLLKTIFFLLASDAFAANIFVDRERRQTGFCGNERFLCKSGQCIDQLNECDGIPNCIDGSDETAEVCSTLRCPNYTFRCSYGACISRQLRCNGENNCRDGSDELDCKAYTEKPAPKYGCALPRQPSNGRWRIYNEERISETHANENTILWFSCNARYKLQPQNNTFALCRNGEWSATAKCTLTCSSIESDDTMLVQCSSNGGIASCSKPYEGTRATVRCRPLYQPTTPNVTVDRICRDGSWNLPLAGELCRPMTTNAPIAPNGGNNTYNFFIVNNYYLDGAKNTTTRKTLAFN